MATGSDGRLGGRGPGETDPAQSGAERHRADILLQLGRLAGQIPHDEFLGRAATLLASVAGSAEAAIYRISWPDQTIRALCTTAPERDAQRFFPAGHAPPDAEQLLRGAIESQAPVIINSPEVIPRSVLRLRPDLQRIISVPIVSGGRATAFALAINKPTDYTDDDIDSMFLVANLLLQNVEQEEARERAEAEAAERQRMMWGIVDALLRVTEIRDPYTAGHQRSVAALCASIGQQLGVDDDAIEGLRVIGSLHDIGKLTIPGEILVKPGPLGDLERAYVRQHSQTGADLLAEVPFRWPIAQAILQHHERLDGSGYPHGIREEIIFEARVVAVADVLDAMSSPRPYRKSHSVHAALEELRFGAGVRYDREIVNACVAVVAKSDWHPAA